MKKHIEEKFEQFCKKNPFAFTDKQLAKIESDIIHPRDGIVCDEYVEFILWSQGLKSRQEYFANYLEQVLPLEQYKTLLDVGCGKTAGLSEYLHKKGYQMTAIDPNLISEAVKSKDIRCIQDVFIFGKTDLTPYDAVVAQEPCDATEHIIRACAKARKNFIISLCGTPHQLINGEQPNDIYEWYDYLENIDKKHCILIEPSIIPGYVSPVMIGLYSF